MNRADGKIRILAVEHFITGKARTLREIKEHLQEEWNITNIDRKTLYQDLYAIEITNAKFQRFGNTGTSIKYGIMEEA